MPSRPGLPLVLARPCRPGRVPATVYGDDRPVADYLVGEVLAGLSHDQREVLRRGASWTVSPRSRPSTCAAANDAVDLLNALERKTGMVTRTGIRRGMPHPGAAAAPDASFDSAKAAAAKPKRVAAKRPCLKGQEVCRLQTLTGCDAYLAHACPAAHPAARARTDQPPRGRPGARRPRAASTAGVGRQSGRCFVAIGATAKEEAHTGTRRSVAVRPIGVRPAGKQERDRDRRGAVFTQRLQSAGVDGHRRPASSPSRIRAVRRQGPHGFDGPRLSTAIQASLSGASKTGVAALELLDWYRTYGSDVAGFWKDKVGPLKAARLDAMFLVYDRRVLDSFKKYLGDAPPAVAKKVSPLLDVMFDPPAKDIEIEFRPDQFVVPGDEITYPDGKVGPAQWPLGVMIAKYRGMVQALIRARGGPWESRKEPSGHTADPSKPGKYKLGGPAPVVTKEGTGSGSTPRSGGAPRSGKLTSRSPTARPRNRSSIGPRAERGRTRSR